MGGQKMVKAEVLVSSLVISFFFLVIAFGGSGQPTMEVHRLPLQGIYEYCSLSSPESLKHLDRMGESGFKLVLNYGSGSSNNSEAEYIAYLDRAQKNGIEVIWDFNELAGAANGPAQAAGVVNIVKHHPATWGYCVGDENAETQAKEVLDLSQAIKAADPDHPRLFVGMMSVDTLAPFTDTAEVMGLDVYPIGDCNDSQMMLDEVSGASKELKEFNAENGKRTFVALQAFNWADDKFAPDWSYLRWPTREEMRQMRDLAIKNSDPEMILWFSYYHTGKEGAESHWQDLRWAAFGDDQSKN
jgi:hypothetical protein